MFLYDRTFHGMAIHCRSFDLLGALSSGKMKGLQVTRGSEGPIRVGKSFVLHHLVWRSDIQYSTSSQFVDNNNGMIFTYDLWCIVFEGAKSKFLIIAVPFKKMLGGFSRALSKELAGHNPTYYRVALKSVIDIVRETGRIKKGITVDGLDFHVFGEERSKEVVLMGDDPVNSSVYSIILEHLKGVTLAPSLIGISSGLDSQNDEKKVTVTATYNGLYSFNVSRDPSVLASLEEIFNTLDRLKFFIAETDRPVLRGREESRETLLAHYNG